MSHRIGTILLIVINVACASDKKYAPDRNFYFEIVNHGKDATSVKLAAYIKKQIPQKKYTITNQSGLTWPFYRELELNERISQDSLMPPHWFLHRMILLKKDQEIRPDEFLVRIDVMPQADTLPNYNVRIFRRDSTGLKLSAQTGIHFLDSAEFTSPNNLLEVYLKSVIRYTFK
jgi:hypothetical protein